jgi:hypothetical protein
MRRMCSCPICNELDMQDPREIVEAFFEYASLHDDVDLKDIFFQLFTAGYKQGYVTSVMLRIEEDVETLKYVNNNWNE